MVGGIEHSAVLESVNQAKRAGALVVTVPANFLIRTYLLKEGALAWISPSLAGYDLEFLSFLCFIGTKACEQCLG